MKNRRITHLAAALALAGLAGNALAAAPIKIAIAGPVTGSVAQYGDMQRIGALAAIEQINKAPLVKSQSKKLHDAIEQKERELAKIVRYKQAIYQDWKDGEITHSDYRHMKEVAAVLRQLSTEGVTVYVITHDLELLLDCCTDIIHFAQGNIAGQYPMDAGGLSRVCAYFMGSGA